MVERHTPLAALSTNVAPIQNTKRASTGGSFGDISIFCAWSPAAEHAAGATSLSSDGNKEKESLTELMEATETASSPEPTMTSNADVPSGGDPLFMVTSEEVSLTVWRAKRVSAVPNSERGMFTLAELRTIIPRLIINAREKVAPAGVPLYYVLHVGAINKTPIRSSRWHGQRWSTADAGATGGLAGRPDLDIETFKQLLDMLDEVRTEMGLGLVPENTDGTDVEIPVLDAAYYEHYSPLRRGRGYLVLDPRFSLVVDCAEEDVLTLLTMLQQARITQNGLTAPGYAAVQMRVSLWDSNSDVQASLDDLAKVSRDGTISSLGQILLSFALAGIGILLALTPLLGARSEQLVAPMLIYAMAAIVHALFALTGRSIFNWLGILCLVIATVLAVVIFAVPSFVIPFLPVRP